MAARYLIRFDDLCPAMDRARWDRNEQLMRRFGVRPLIAIVPENCDPELERDEADPGFWEHMRELQADGWTVGLHGFQHLCEAQGWGLVPLHERTEFAGLPEARHENSPGQRPGVGAPTPLPHPSGVQ